MIYPFLHPLLYPTSHLNCRRDIARGKLGRRLCHYRGYKKVAWTGTAISTPPLSLQDTNTHLHHGWAAFNSSAVSAFHRYLLLHRCPGGCPLHIPAQLLPLPQNLQGRGQQRRDHHQGVHQTHRRVLAQGATGGAHKGGTAPQPAAQCAQLQQDRGVQQSRIPDTAAPSQEPVRPPELKTVPARN